MKEYISTIAYDVFIVFFLLFTASVFIEGLRKGLVVNYIDTNLLLILTLLSGLGAVLVPHHTRQRTQTSHRWYIQSFLTALCVAFVVAVWSADAPIWKLFFAAAAFLVTFFVCAACRIEEES